MPSRVSKRIALFACVALGVSLAALLRANAGRRRPPQPALDAHASIARAMASLLEALHRSDPHAYAEHFAADALSLPGASEPVRGRAAIANAMGATFAKVRFVEAEMSTLDTRADDTTVVEAGRYRYVVAINDTGAVQTLTGRYAIAWQRHAGGWEIALDVGQPAARANE
jgi:uncharacterized protein (TIGR02246 family)